MQLMRAGDPTLDEERYVEVIRRKTAKLFEAAARLGAVLGGAPPAREDAFARYGMHLGSAFQIMDDVLDYTGDPDAIGKNLGDDLAEGKMTLPLIRALAVGSDDDRALIRAAIRRGPPDDFGPVVGVLDAHRRARLHARPCASAKVPPRPNASAACRIAAPGSLLQLATFAARRTY